MVQLLIENALTYSGKKVDIQIQDGLISSISPINVYRVEADHIIRAEGDIVIPGLCNSHTHAPMNLLRGVGEDKELGPWLEESIWPMEAKMGTEHLRSGMALACCEMILSGTTLFNDMYFREHELIDIVSDLGLRAFLGEGFIDLFDPEKREDNKRSTLRTLNAIDEKGNPLISGELAPHAVYTVSEEGLHWCMEEARKRDLPFHIHLSETEKENVDLKEKTGKGPVDLLCDLDILGPNVIAAHCVHLTEKDISILSKKKVNISHQPISNMKLSVGGPMKASILLKKGLNVVLGTDGAASNNSLDMFQTMKIAALLGKQYFGASSINSQQVLDMATWRGYDAFGLKGGRLHEGCLADLIILDRKNLSMSPMNNITSNIIYSGSGSMVKHSVIGGRIVMMDRVIPGIEGIMQKAQESASDLMGV